MQLFNANFPRVFLLREENRQSDVPIVLRRPTFKVRTPLRSQKTQLKEQWSRATTAYLLSPVTPTRCQVKSTPRAFSEKFRGNNA